MKKKKRTNPMHLSPKISAEKKEKIEKLHSTENHAFFNSYLYSNNNNKHEEHHIEIKTNFKIFDTNKQI